MNNQIYMGNIYCWRWSFDLCSRCKVCSNIKQKEKFFVRKLDNFSKMLEKEGEDHNKGRVRKHVILFKDCHHDNNKVI